MKDAMHSTFKSIRDGHVRLSSEGCLSSLDWLNGRYRHMKKELKGEGQKVLLGRSFSLGTQFQYEFARRLFLNNPAVTLVLVDHPISIPGRRQPIYPDIVLIRDGRLVGIVDVKIDLGFLHLGHYGIKENRAGYLYSKADNEFMWSYYDLIKAGKFTYKVSHDRNGRKNHNALLREVVVGKDIKRLAIVVTQINHHGKRSLYETAVKDADFEPLFLLKSCHPNDDRYSAQAARREFLLSHAAGALAGFYGI